jgi:hypothetical protein
MVVEGHPASQDASTASSLRWEMGISLAYSIAHHREARWEARTRTDIETPHVLEASFLIATAEYPSHIVDEGDGVRAKAVSGECTPYGSLAPIHHGWRCGFDVHHVWGMRDRAKTRRWVGDWDAGRLCGGSRERG